MKTISIRVVGKKQFKSKAGNEITILYFVSSPFERGVQGAQAGYFFADDDVSVNAEVDQNYTAILGYDRAGKYGVVGILE